MPRQTSLLGLPAKFQTWTLAAWLWPGPESQLSKFSFRGTPSSTTPCPSPPPGTAGLPDLYVWVTVQVLGAGGAMGGPERRAASSSYQTLSQFFPQHFSLHPWSPKLVCPDEEFCLACLPSFRPGRWLCGSGQALSLNFYKTRYGVRPAAPTPAPPLPLTPQGCLICKSGSLCKFWGRGVRWAGLRALV